LYNYIFCSDRRKRKPTLTSCSPARSAVRPSKLVGVCGSMIFTPA
ncbi:MAG: hypothetical protein ACI80W_001531, partial [Porticoccaceae bacterium]